MWRKLVMPLYQRKTQPPVEALQWDGEEKTLNEAIRLAGDYSHLIVSWKNKKALNIQLLTTGLKRASGIIDEEFLPALRGRKAIKVYREMSLNDPMVGALLFAIDKLIRAGGLAGGSPGQHP
jgi:hypothetical protein